VVRRVVAVCFRLLLRCYSTLLLTAGKPERPKPPPKPPPPRPPPAPLGRAHLHVGRQPPVVVGRDLVQARERLDADAHVARHGALAHHLHDVVPLALVPKVVVRKLDRVLQRRHRREPRVGARLVGAHPGDDGGEDHVDLLGAQHVVFERAHLLADVAQRLQRRLAHAVVGRRRRHVGEECGDELPPLAARELDRGDLGDDERDGAAHLLRLHGERLQQRAADVSAQRGVDGLPARDERGLAGVVFGVEVVLEDDARQAAALRGLLGVAELVGEAAQEARVVLLLKVLDLLLGLGAHIGVWVLGVQQQPRDLNRGGCGGCHRADCSDYWCGLEVVLLGLSAPGHAPDPDATRPASVRMQELGERLALHRTLLLHGLGAPLPAPQCCCWVAATQQRGCRSIAAAPFKLHVCVARITQNALFHPLCFCHSYQFDDKVAGCSARARFLLTAAIGLKLVQPGRHGIPRCMQASNHTIRGVRELFRLRLAAVG